MVASINGTTIWTGCTTGGAFQGPVTTAQTEFSQLMETCDEDTDDNLDTISRPGLGLLAEPLILPTMHDVQELSADLAEALGKFFLEQGVYVDEDVEFSVNPNSGYVSVKGDFPEAGRIEELVNQDEDISERIRTLNATASIVYGMQRALEFQEKYRAGADPEMLMREYSDLFDDRPTTSSITYNGENTSLTMDGKAWPRVEAVASS